MSVRLLPFTLVAVTLLCACGPFEVRSGPDSCRVARIYPSSFDAPGRGNVFRFREDAGVGLIAREGQITALKSLWTVEGLVAEDIPRGTALDVALRDRVLHLEVGVDASAHVHTRLVRGSPPHDRVLTTWEVLAALDDQSLEALAASPTRALRLTLPSGRQEMQVPPDAGARLQSLAICLAGGYPVR